MKGRMWGMEMKFCPRIVKNIEAKDNAEALSGGMRKNEFCLHIAHIAHVGLTERGIFWQIGGV